VRRSLEQRFLAVTARLGADEQEIREEAPA
jgi:hypothetical protein